MLPRGMGETHVSRFLSAMGADPPSKGCLRNREREVDRATKKTCQKLLRESDRKGSRINRFSGY